ncbi:hypothetical protein [Salipiger abyssi]|uniref:hypothetical protein n=1 Tax=Salipiger abyssi TaxID=1250539 RepID=UPI001A8C5F20|nr:hypothetical protein [Salipiger abyssi]MBN9890414.1 hypothetical protein [Salipiger abyssi]
MIVVIQCAGSKRADAGSLSAPDGRPVRFVAHPELAPDDGEFYARPDDACGGGSTWRDLLSAINQSGTASPPNLLAAGTLYRPAVYQGLLEHVGREKLYILSAGWGLVRSDFQLPDYDITFSGQAERYKRRRKVDRYEDFSMLPRGSDEPILFFGSKDYLPLFRQLSADYRGQRIVLFRSAEPPDCPECVAVRYDTPRRTNWHYEAAESYIAGNLQLPVR